MNDKYAGWKMPVPPASTYNWTPLDWEKYTEQTGICPKCIEDARKDEVDSFHAQYVPAPGTPFRIAMGVSEMERELAAKRPNEVYTFMEFDRHHGYYVCTDEDGARWCLHPEALQQTTLQQKLTQTAA